MNLNNKRTGILPVFVAGVMVYALGACSGATTPSGNAASRSSNTENPSAFAPATEPVNHKELPTSTPAATPVMDTMATERFLQTATQQMQVGEVDSMLESVHEVLGNGRIELFQSEPMTIDVKGVNQKKNAILPVNTDVADFAFHTSVTWNSDLGSAGCGLLYRIERGDPGMGPYYEFAINRFSGLPYYWIDQNDSYLNIKRVGFGYTGFLFDSQGSQNDILFIVKGSEFQIYINHQRSNVFYDANIAQGQFALEALTVSGNASCKFEDTWIWSWGKH
jgi:hypothetical protein